MFEPERYAGPNWTRSTVSCSSSPATSPQSRTPSCRKPSASWPGRSRPSSRLQQRLAALKLLIVDELGYVPLSPSGAELLFEVFSRRYERGSVLVTSNLPFDEWTSVFGPERLTSSTPGPASPRPHPRDERRELTLKVSRRRQGKAETPTNAS